MKAASAALQIGNPFRLADRIKFQQDAVRNKEYIVLGRLSAVLFEAQRNTSGLSQSQARYASREQRDAISGTAMAPFSEKQTTLWASITLDWLGLKNAPVIAVSKDRRDILLPNGLTPLPAIPNPHWNPQHSQSVCPKSTRTGCSKCVPPRIPQLLTGCPIVGDRVTQKITARDKRVWGVVQPVTALSVVLSGNGGAFMPVRCGVDPVSGTHMALLMSEDGREGYFTEGSFQFGG